ncbi:MAG: hypothetical protein JO069_20565 [Verrucomicrobia bacterium]|nr:hypothetical protein [Verrucomicrobiota bacterium]
MSVDIDASSPVNLNILQVPVRDLFVLIGGWASEEAFKLSPAPELPPTPIYSSTGDLLRRVQSNELTLPNGHEKRTIGLKGRMLDDDVTAAFEFIQQNFDPRGKVIILGHSMGGAAVHRLCRQIDSQGPFYNLKHGGLTASPTSTGINYEIHKPNVPLGPFYDPGVPSSSSAPYSGPPPAAVPGPPGRPVPWIDPDTPPNPRARVDLLVTVDAAIGNLSESLDRSVSPCVRTNLNYYQTERKNVEKSRGGPNKATDPEKTIVWNHDLTDREPPDPDASKPPSKPDHYSIQAQLNNLIMKIFQQAVDVKQVTDFWNP